MSSDDIRKRRNDTSIRDTLIWSRNNELKALFCLSMASVFLLAVHYVGNSDEPINK